MSTASLTGTALLDQHVVLPISEELGEVVAQTHVRSSEGPFKVLPNYLTRYPQGVIDALGILYGEYNRAFSSLAAANQEWDSDYQHCRDLDGTPVNFAVQIDMVGLPQGFLLEAATMPMDMLVEILRKRIFEIENSLAMYQLLERLFANGDGETFFRRQFRQCLANLRKRFGMEIALLAVTDQKFEAMRTSEFGKENGEPLSGDEVRSLSGFDHFFGPDEFRRHVTENGGSCRHLLYARTSDPVAKLKKPEFVVEHPLLGDSDMRRIIKSQALTFNIDAPDMSFERRINDTKAYAMKLDMAFPVYSMDDMHPPEFLAYLARGNAYADYPDTRVSATFSAYLRAQGFDLARIEEGDLWLRAKPMMGTYGCYGHVSGLLRDSDFRCDLRSNLRRRGPYVLQPEMPGPVIVNTTNEQEYICIDRVFLARTNGHPQWLGGLRSLMPKGSKEAQNGRNHGSRDTVWAEIR